jgi:type IV pilus assembly protein PilM
MRFIPFRFVPKSFLGVDVGTSAIKVVELQSWGKRKSLKNYGELQSSSLYEKPFRTFEKNTLLLSSKDLAKAMKGVLQESGITTKQAVFSIPDFSSFFTHFTLPPMSKEELGEAVKFEARKHIPLPLSEVTIDWQIAQGRFDLKTPFQILLVAVPNEIINQYQEIAALAELRLVALEAEVFGLVRSCLQATRSPVVLLDIGAQSTTVNVVVNNVLKISHSTDIAGNNLTERVSQSLSIDKKSAQEQKHAKGMLSQDLAVILSPLLDMIGGEITKISQEFSQIEGREVERVLMAGGSALLPGLREYFEANLKKPVDIADPFARIFYPPILEPKIKELGVSYAVALGMALRGLE